MSNNIAKEKRIVARMIAIYCKANHKDSNLCHECQELCDYAYRRLDLCRYGEDKGVCNKCQTHCYRPQMRTKITEVMRYSGKRMIFYSPAAAIWHLWKMLKS